MKRMVLALALALTMCGSALPAMAVDTSDLAPADQYFGHLKMSILGIRNSLKDLSASLDVHPENADHIFDKAVLVEDALRDWQSKYPRDPWIPRYTFSLAQLYDKIQTDDARVRSHETMQWLIATYPESEFAQLDQ